MPPPPPTPTQPTLPQRASPADVNLLALDVDGVLTDGSILIDDRGRETKRFNISDGLGMRVWLPTRSPSSEADGAPGGA